MKNLCFRFARSSTRLTSAFICLLALAAPQIIFAQFKEPFTEFASTAARSVIVRDINYLPLRGERWCYLAVWQDMLHAAHRRLDGSKANGRTSR